MSCLMVGYPLFDTTQPGQLSKLLIHFRVTRQSSKTSDIRITIKNAQCPAFKQQMQRQTDFHPCLDGFEVQPPLAVYPNKILRCELAEVRIAQSGITAEQESIEHMAHGLFFHFDCFQLLQLVRGKKLMSAFLLLDLVFPKGISVRVHISLVDCLIDQGTELSHVLGYRIDRIALFSQVLLKITKECIGKIFEVQSGTEIIQDRQCRVQVVLGGLLLVRIVNG